MASRGAAIEGAGPDGTSLRRWLRDGKQRRRAGKARFPLEHLAMPAAGELTKPRPDLRAGLATSCGRQLLRLIDQRRQTLLLASLFLILVGSRAAVIGYAGNPTP
jgi:hypothetical protein